MVEVFSVQILIKVCSKDAESLDEEHVKKDEEERELREIFKALYKHKELLTEGISNC